MRCSCKQREGFGQELEYHRAVFQLAAQPAESGSDDAAVVEGKLDAGAAARACRQALVAAVFGHEFDFVEEFVALEDSDRVPGARVAKVRAHAVLAGSIAPGPARERRQQRFADGRRHPGASVFPGQQVVGVNPGGARCGLGFFDQPEVGNGEIACAILRALAVAIAERVELFDVADRESRLRRNPAPQSELQRRICVGVEEARRQGGHTGANLRRRQDTRPARGDGHDDGIQTQGKSARHGAG